MKSSPKRACEKKRIKHKGLLSFLNSLWVVIIAFMLDLGKKVIANE